MVGKGEFTDPLPSCAPSGDTNISCAESVARKQNNNENIEKPGVCRSMVCPPYEIRVAFI
jgi:hypothetical protein